MGSDNSSVPSAITITKLTQMIWVGLYPRGLFRFFEKVLAEMLHDKKAQGGQITVIKVPGLGCWRAETIPVEGLRPLLGMED